MEDLLSVDQFAFEVRLTPRTIRAYHARGLLPPPIRVGRAPFYGNHHLQRMRLVLRMQSAGLPLEAVRALLEPDVVLYDALQLGQFIRYALRSRPGLLRTLLRAGLLAPQHQGGYEARGIRAIVATRELHPPDFSPAQSLELLAETIIQATPHARAAMEQVRHAIAEHDLPEVDHRRQIDLAVEVFRVGLGSAECETTVSRVS